MSAAEGGGIFISYRRQETSHLAGRLYDRLADRFGESQVFIDVATIEPGVDFAEEIFRAVAACTVLLAIIGPTWLTAADERGHRRLDDPDDIVRLEIEAALARTVRIIPILVESAVMPTHDDLPESLADLARRNALLIRHESFRADAGRLIAAIERVPTAPGAALGTVSEISQRGRETARTTRAALQGTTGADGSMLPTVTSAGLEARVHPTVVTIPYIHRDQEEVICDHLRAGRPVLLIGSSMVGKTKMAAQVIIREFGDRPTAIPDSKTALGAC